VNNHYRQTRFLLGAPDARRAPPDTGFEVAFAGRSNAGKSSALNTLTGQRALARISKAPGRTREINFFQVAHERRLVDLPGYGYAKVTRRVREQWQEGIARYLETRRSLCGVVLLMDVRHPLRDSDRQVLGWCHLAGLPTHVLLTKADKLKRGPAQAALMQVRKSLSASATAQVFSARSRDGLEQLIERLNDWFALAGSPPSVEPGSAEGAKAADPVNSSG
jgi:GTP-binding protein